LLFPVYLLHGSSWFLWERETNPQIQAQKSWRSILLSMLLGNCGKRTTVGSQAGQQKECGGLQEAEGAGTDLQGGHLSLLSTEQAPSTFLRPSGALQADLPLKANTEAEQARSKSWGIMGSWEEGQEHCIQRGMGCVCPAHTSQHTLDPQALSRSVMPWLCQTMLLHHVPHSPGVLPFWFPKTAADGGGGPGWLPAAFRSQPTSGICQ
jgi:hypothetical protein